MARHCHSDLTDGGCEMQGGNPISWLMFFTLAATVFIIAAAFITFLRSRTNREIAAAAL
jgi:hypothetical protein